MHPYTKHIRIGVDKNSNVHIEVWPMEYGWQRDVDPALSSADPEQITLSNATAFAIGAFMARHKDTAIQEVIDLHNEQSEHPENDYEEGYTQALLDSRRILEQVL